MRLLKAFITIALLGVFATAQEWAKEVLNKSPRHQEWVEVKRGDRTIHSFVVYPESKKKAPVIIVIHENTGLTDWARSVADQLAARGYIAIAPDLLSGASGKAKTTDFASADEAREAIRSLKTDDVYADLNAVADYAKEIPAANGKIAVSGFCWGGARSFGFANVRRDLAAAYVFYGPSPDDISGIKAPVYGFYAENDARVNTTIDPVAEKMKAAGKTFKPVTYAGAGHGFMRSGQDPAGTEANRKAREDAWKRWLELLSKL
jgi:carboxymethylenebutenolidase